MKSLSFLVIPFLVLGMLMANVGALKAAEPLRVCCTTPDLGSLAQEIGGHAVEVAVFVGGQEDPHALTAKPSDVQKLSKAQAFVLVGFGLEAGWAPALLSRSRNSAIQLGTSGYLDASEVIQPIHDVPQGTVITRALGDQHAEGNPHYLLDPVNGLQVARWLAERFTNIRPDLSTHFKTQVKDFEQKWGAKAFGREISQRYPLDKLIALQEQGKLSAFLQKTEELPQLKGWFAQSEALAGTPFLADHGQWPYFAKRFRIVIERSLEPKPGVPPNTSYLQNLVVWVKNENIPGILASPYFSPRTLNFMAEHSSAKIIPVAHQVGARPQANSYLEMIDYNMSVLYNCCSVKP